MRVIYTPWEDLQQRLPLRPVRFWIEFIEVLYVREGVEVIAVIDSVVV